MDRRGTDEVMGWIRMAQDRHQWRGNEPSGHINCWEFLEQLGRW
jgi:hypothetical protein